MNINKLIKKKILKAHFAKPPISDTHIDEQAHQRAAKQRKLDQVNKAIEFYKKCVYCGYSRNFTYIKSKQRIECNSCGKGVYVKDILRIIPVERAKRIKGKL